MNCKCGVELFDCDVIHLIKKPDSYQDKQNWFEEIIGFEPMIHCFSTVTHRIYRCPKCFRVKKVMLK